MLAMALPVAVLLPSPVAEAMPLVGPVVPVVAVTLQSAPALQSARCLAQVRHVKVPEEAHRAGPRRVQRRVR